MAIPLAVALMLGGLAGGLGGAAISNAGAKNRQRQADATNLRFWEMQNQYNHPIEQMLRLQEAGLNPNMIYGSSPGSAVGNASNIAPSKAAPFDMGTLGIQEGLQGYATGVQAENTAANTIKTLADADIKGVELDLLKDNYDSLVELQKHKTDGALETLKQQKFNTLKISQTWKNEVQLISEQLKIAKKDNQLKNYEIILKKLDKKFAEAYNLRPQDPFWARTLMQIHGMLTQFQATPDFKMHPKSSQTTPGQGNNWYYDEKSKKWYQIN